MEKIARNIKLGLAIVLVGLVGMIGYGNYQKDKVMQQKNPLINQVYSKAAGIDKILEFEEKVDIARGLGYTSLINVDDKINLMYSMPFESYILEVGNTNLQLPKESLEDYVNSN